MELTLEEFIEMNKVFLNKIAYYYSTNIDMLGIEFEDLYQIGCLALIEKYPEYDAAKGTVSTFSYWVIRDAILNYIRDNCTLTHVPKYLATLSRRYAKENELFYKTNGRYMTLEEQKQLLKDIDAKNYKRINLAEELNKINLYHYRDRVYSIEDEIENYDYSGNVFELNVPVLINDCIASDVDIETEVITKLSMEEFINSLTYLNERERDVFLENLGLYDDIPKTFMFLAEKHGVTYQQTNKDYHQAIRKIKSHVKKS